MGKYRYSEKEIAFIEGNPVPFAVYQLIDERVVTIGLSAGFYRLFGFRDLEEAYDIMDNDMYRYVHEDDKARAAEAALAFTAKKLEYDIVYRTRVYDDYRIIHSYGKHVYPEEGVQLAVMWYTDEGVWNENSDSFLEEFGRSIEARLKEESFQQEMNYDFLTGLPSMTYFFRLAEVGRARMRERGEMSVILFADMNGMKSFNSKFGFSEGDKLLKAFAEILVRHFGKERCSRFGRDHFAVYTVAEGVEEKLQAVLKEAKTMNAGRSLPIKVGIYLDSLGVLETSLACDRAKYACDIRRKDFSSYYTYFDESMLAKENNRQYILNNLDRAIEEGWIKAYYQPIVRTANGRVSDEEALARWIDPERGMLSPAEFIPVLEDAKLIYKMDLYMVDLILEKMKNQAASGLYVVPNSVNLSRTDFDCCDIVDEICRKVDAAGIGRDMLTIEITESVLGNDFDFIKSQIDRMKELGFKVWMDDFGSGYSSLNILHEVEFDLIKLDMLFMKQFAKGNEKSRIILTELIRMATALGIETVCEGVETVEQVEFLKEAGCTKLQGYFYCKAIPLEDIVERYKTGIQIGFENPAESGYFESIGNVNLYDLAVMAGDDSDTLRDYYDTLPMAVVEIDDDGMRIVRCNNSYRIFVENYFFGEGTVPMQIDPKILEKLSAQIDPELLKKSGEPGHTWPSYFGKVPFAMFSNGPGNSFADVLRKCAKEGGRIFLDDTDKNNENVVHACVRRISINPVTHNAACAVVVLGIDRN